MSWACWSLPSSTPINVTTGVFIADDFWHFVVAVIDHPAAGDLRVSLYVDGVAVGTKVYPLFSVATPSNVEFGPSSVALDEPIITLAPITLDRVVELYLAGLREGSLRPQVETPIAAIAADHPRAWYRLNDGPDAKGFADSRGLTPTDDWITKVGTMTPTMWYRLDEAAGAISYANSGSLTGADLVNISGASNVINGALLFDGNTGRSYPGTGEFAQKAGLTGRTYTEKLTIAFWVDISSMTTPVATLSILQIVDAAKHVSVMWPICFRAVAGHSCNRRDAYRVDYHCEYRGRQPLALARLHPGESPGYVASVCSHRTMTARSLRRTPTPTRSGHHPLRASRCRPTRASSSMSC